jgi:hypothetical protein
MNARYIIQRSDNKKWIVVDLTTNGCAYFGMSKKDCVEFAKYWNFHEATRR